MTVHLVFQQFKPIAHLNFKNQFQICIKEI